MSVITVTVPPSAAAAPRDAVHAAVGRLVHERDARGIAQALHTARDLLFGIALAVIAVLREVAKERRIGPARLEQPGRNRIDSAKRSLQVTMSRFASV